MDIIFTVCGHLARKRVNAASCIAKNLAEYRIRKDPAMVERLFRGDFDLADMLSEAGFDYHQNWEFDPKSYINLWQALLEMLLLLWPTSSPQTTEPMKINPIDEKQQEMRICLLTLWGIHGVGKEAIQRLWETIHPDADTCSLIRLADYLPPN